MTRFPAFPPKVCQPIATKTRPLGPWPHAEPTSEWSTAHARNRASVEPSQCSLGPCSFQPRTRNEREALVSSACSGTDVSFWLPVWELSLCLLFQSCALCGRARVETFPVEWNLGIQNKPVLKTFTRRISLYTSLTTRHPIGHFTVVCFGTWLMKAANEAGGDLPLIQTSLLFSRV